MTKHTTISINVTLEQADQIRRAAKRSEKTVSEYGCHVLGAWAASDLGEPAAQRAPTARRVRSPISEAAKRHGMTHSQYRQMAAEIAAKLELAGKLEVPLRPSGFYSKTGS